MNEVPWLWAGAALMVAGALRALSTAFVAGRAPSDDRWPFLLLAASLGAVGLGIGLRWARLGHGPFLDMFEILASSLLSLGLVYAVASRRSALLRAGVAIVLPVLALLALWLLATEPKDTFFPPTYETPLLWFHVLLGKLFLGIALLALGLSGLVLLRMSPRAARAFTRLPPDTVLDAAAWRLMPVALVFESLMLIAGAAWAQAWGRWWAWDPLETWAFLTWLLLGAAVHARRVWHIGPRAGALLIVTVFALAFLTFFGVPFISVAPHKGAV